MTDIKTLLPQRAPFLFVDKIISATPEEILGIKTYDSTFLFYQEYFSKQKIIPNMLLVESLVQCGGAGITRLGLFKNVLWGLAAVENVRFFDFIEPNATVTMTVKNLKISQIALKQTGVAFYQDKAILEATWLCLRLPNEIVRTS
ncbi:3-hydroxyacyl-[acyl-carrier-protein] dehydratase [Sporomusaceae bacterium BoRhaA]|uniref:3-hydroxyacyl-ACP dehydratase FabZ family protein n=1 Tax=Pelorhabdus rhamnosifermentans TaxID=2772457 RepID=UPI001C061402|nr:3-hydroxyacyl-ACP dehydratase [Pelorhabdus rhamnosifermentans]MBU2701810.1 3-hydroxyacyl-[acyl-carrier-protein] dehydratase [Pelorhabdus rhamnosifermentans]